ncbi:MAG: hypothetical protein F6J87_23735 [Spirulina sp. SIO3F2]|nr:hypothetical protein [Spirulina sp. SIO3F2]
MNNAGSQLMLRSRQFSKLFGCNLKRKMLWNLEQEGFRSKRNLYHDELMLRDRFSILENADFRTLILLIPL